MKIKANCKINIGLDVLRRREDGFHELSSVMYPIVGLYDLVDVEVAVEGVSFRSLGLIVDCPEDENLCVRAAKMMMQCYNVAGVAITLDKRVPFGAGLGGGSSDATAVILAINELFALHLSEAELLALAAELGSDTPFFVRNTPQLCSGRGEIMEPVDLDLGSMTIVMIKPDINISTREAYSGIVPSSAVTPLSELISRPLSEWQGAVKNDFEHHLLELHPLLREVKGALLEAGARYAAMSGSGSTLFGIFDSVDSVDMQRLSRYEILFAGDLLNSRDMAATVE